MKADLYVQGHFWGAIDVPGDSLLSLLAQGMLTRAALRATELQDDLNALAGIDCTISLRLKKPVVFTPDPQRQDPHGVQP